MTETEVEPVESNQPQVESSEPNLFMTELDQLNNEINMTYQLAQKEKGMQNEVRQWMRKELSNLKDKSQKLEQALRSIGYTFQ